MKATKEEIVLAARELFRDNGYAGTSMQDLATRVGLQKASLYVRFPNKESLVSEVLRLTLEETFAGPDVASSDWRIAYKAVVRSMAKNLTRYKRCVGLHLAYGIGDDTPEAKDAVRLFFHSCRDRMSAILANAMPAKTARTMAADALARLEGATLLLMLFDDADAMRRATENLLEEAGRIADARLPSRRTQKRR